MNSRKKKSGQLSAVSRQRPKKHPQFPRVMWADVDTDCKHTPVAIYPTKSEQRGNRPDLKPIKVLVVALEGKFDQSVISEAIDVLNRCAEQGHKLS